MGREGLLLDSQLVALFILLAILMHIDGLILSVLATKEEKDRPNIQTYWVGKQYFSIHNHWPFCVKVIPISVDSIGLLMTLR